MSRSVAIIGTRGYPSYYGGFETLVRRLAPYLVSEGWDVTVYGRGGAVKPDDPARDLDVKSVLTWGLESKSLSTLSFGLSSTISAAKNKPDVALVMNVANGYWLPMLKARGIPSVVNVDGIEWERAKWGKSAKAAFRMGASLTARFADHLLYDAEGIAGRWEASFGRSGTVIPYGGEDPGPLPTPDGLNSGRYVLMVARFVPENTVEEFFDAAENLANEVDVVIVGSSGYGGEFDERAESLQRSNDRVHWYGHVSDDRLLFSLWQHAGAYFHGHSVGGTNPALVQAMACGAPIVARDTIFNREVLGDCALFAAPNSEQITDSIRSLISDKTLQARLGSAAKVRAAKYYSWESVCLGYQDLLKEAIS
ncbi:glycosyltransferase [Rhodococcus globerulus]|uniref:glycosyltransferase n=1 Tax=Rhodococcus globerulus TaxID=33008 RepID=UPI001C5654B6|nr:glycosyltransferase [Rhodococcus globerulus]QXW04666.1 glycosyltransferase [Rhodococcus globerulus]